MTMKMRLKMKKRLSRCDKNRPRAGQRYTKYKMYLSIMTVICIKQLSDI